jgi:hypothetical protein
LHNTISVEIEASQRSFFHDQRISDRDLFATEIPPAILFPDIMTFLLPHGETDIDHAAELRTVLNTMIDGDYEAAIVNRSAVLELAHINHMLMHLRRGSFVATEPFLMDVGLPQPQALA